MECEEEGDKEEMRHKGKRRERMWRKRKREGRGGGVPTEKRKMQLNGGKGWKGGTLGI